MNKKLLHILTTLCLAVVLAISPSLFKINSAKENVRTTTVEVTQSTMNYESILNEFVDAELVTDGSLTTFMGYKAISLAQLSQLDNLSETDIQENSEVFVKYNFSYDSETNVVTLAAEMHNEYGEIELDTITGIAFLNEFGNIDALLDVDGDYILLSELQDAGMIENCGWFSRVLKIAAAAAAAALVVTVVVATCGAALPAVIAVGAAVGAAAGAAAAMVITYVEDGSIDWLWVAGGAVGGAAVGAAVGAVSYYTVAFIKSLAKKVAFSNGSFSSVDDCVNYHFTKHGAEVGAKTAAEYAKMAATFAKNVIAKGTPAIRAVAGATANVFRYELGGYYIHMAIEGANIIIVSFGLIG